MTHDEILVQLFHEQKYWFYENFFILKKFLRQYSNYTMSSDINILYNSSVLDLKWAAHASQM